MRRSIRAWGRFRVLSWKAAAPKSTPTADDYLHTDSHVLRIGHGDGERDGNCWLNGAAGAVDQQVSHPTTHTLSTTQTTTVRWEAVNGGQWNAQQGQGLNRSSNDIRTYVSGSDSIGPLTAGTHTYSLTVRRRTGDHSGRQDHFPSLCLATPPPDPPVTIDSFTRDDPFNDRIRREFHDLELDDFQCGLRATINGST